MDTFTDKQVKLPPSVAFVVVITIVVFVSFIRAFIMFMVVSLGDVVASADVSILVVAIDVVVSSVVCALFIISVSTSTSFVVGCWVSSVSVAVTTDNIKLFVIISFTEVIYTPKICGKLS